MANCEKHHLTVAGPDCPICRAERFKVSDGKCKRCTERELFVQSKTCAECILNPRHPHFKDKINQ